MWGASIDAGLSVRAKPGLVLLPLDPALSHISEDQLQTTLTFPRSQEGKLVTYSSLVKICPNLFFRMLNRVLITIEMPTGREKGRAIG